MSTTDTYSGWAVFRLDTEHVLGVFDTIEEAEAAANEAGPKYQVVPYRRGAISED